MTFLLYLTFALFVIVSIFLILLVLIQKGRGGGLSGAFGGGGGNTAFGSKTGDVLTWATSIVFGVFLVLGIVLNVVANNYNAARAGGPVAPAVAPATPGTPTTPATPAGANNSSLPQPVPAEPGLPAPQPAK